MEYLEQSYAVSERHACCVLEVARATYHYDGYGEPWTELRMRIREIAQARVFVSDQLSDGRRFRSLTVVDIFTREALAIEPGHSLRGEDEVRVLNRLLQQRGTPKMPFCDNGSEFTGQILDLWAYKNGVKIDFSRPGKPTDNAFCESFNGTLRSECLDTNWFQSLAKAKLLIEAWQQE